MIKLNTMNMTKRALKLTLYYFFAGFCWIIVSDYILSLFFNNNYNLTIFQTLKGSLFILVTSVLLFIILKRDYNEIAIETAEASKMLYVVEQSPVSVMITDINGNIEYVNKKFTELTGYSLEEVKGKNPRILKSGRTNPDIYVELWNTITAGKTWEGEFCNKKKNGELYWELTRISPLIDTKTGKILNFIALNEDITYEKRLEEELLHAQKMEAIGSLAGGIAHDFNNILTSIIGYVDVMLIKLEEENPLRHYLEQILVSADRAASLTQNLLTFARKQPTLKRVIDINDVIRQISKMLERIIGEHISLKTRLSQERLFIYADLLQIEQVLMNLASNAKDAIESKNENGEVTIETMPFTMTYDFISKHGFGSPGDYVLIRFSDTGCGIDEKILSRVFEPFFTTKDVGKGTGLGLSIVYGIVKDHRGYVTVESEVNRGTTFNIYLPVTRAEAVENGFERKKVEVKKGTETVLIAEDDDKVRELIKSFFENFGYRVFEAKDGEEALNIFGAQRGDSGLYA